MAMNLEDIQAAANLSPDELAAFASLPPRDLRDIEVLAERDPAGALLAAQGYALAQQDAPVSPWAVFVKVVGVIGQVAGVVSPIGSAVQAIVGVAKVL
jgi:hypothetical protein